MAAKLGNRSLFLIFLSFIFGSILSFLVFHSNVNVSFNNDINHRKRVVLFGDSLTEQGNNPNINGWCSSLNYYWSRRVDIFVRGFGGYNSKWGLEMFDEVVINLQPNLVVIFWGANDAVSADVIQHVSLYKFENNINEMILRIKNKLPSSSIILITPPPVWELELEKRNMEKKKEIIVDRSNQRTKLYSESIIRIGKQYDIPVVDLWQGLDGTKDSRADYLSDGLHLNNKGNQILYELLLSTIKLKLPKWLPDNLPLQKVHWSKHDA